MEYSQKIKNMISDMHFYIDEYKHHLRWLQSNNEFMEKLSVENPQRIKYINLAISITNEAIYCKKNLRKLRRKMIDLEFTDFSAFDLRCIDIPLGC